MNNTGSVVTTGTKAFNSGQLQEVKTDGIKKQAISTSVTAHVPTNTFIVKADKIRAGIVVQIDAAQLAKQTQVRNANLTIRRLGQG